jgi:hypothetical protein
MNVMFLIPSFKIFCFVTLSAVRTYWIMCCCLVVSYQFVTLMYLILSKAWKLSLHEIYLRTNIFTTCVTKPVIS